MMLAFRERILRTNFFCTNFLNSPRGPGHPGKIPGTSQIPPFESQGRQTFEGGHELFGHHPFVRKTPTPPGGLRTQIQGPKFEHKLFFLLLFGHRRDIPAKSRDIPPKKFDFPGFNGHTELFGPPPLHVEDTHPTRRYPDSKVWVWVRFFFPDKS